MRRAARVRETHGARYVKALVQTRPPQVAVDEQGLLALRRVRDCQMRATSTSLPPVMRW